MWAEIKVNQASSMSPPFSQQRPVIRACYWSKLPPAAAHQVKYFQHSVGIFVEELMDGMDVNGSGLMNHYCNSICQITVIDLPECVPWGLLSQDGTAIFSRFKGIHKGKSSDFTM
ncbi:predicted protein [Histoplasma capsulatum H143]|uniref:Uncharacterized protein n=1 Tax=Ajellomyces capsulatus (strain H143) TaxID=544712 RepID=C6H8W9_AJECH|nr:predicted protein [Histoplasma capsulatum H143]